MITLGQSPLQRARTLGARFFHRFGIHCATHQIRIILVSCVVITSLFYPALSLYSSSPSQTLAYSTSRILHSFLSANALTGQHDLHNVWTGNSALREDTTLRALCGQEWTLRVERILIQTPLVEDAGTPNQQTLLATLHLEKRISQLLSKRKSSCLRKSDGQCFVLSSLAFWNHNEDVLLADKDVMDTLGRPRNITVDGIPLTPHMVLAGRGASEDVSSGFDSAMFLALTYFFPDEDCSGSSEHTTWLRLVETAAGDAKVVLQTQAPTLLALQYTSSSQPKPLSAISTILYLAYIAFFAYVTWSVRRMDAVHSRIGLTFTALVEIAVSTVTSLSVCALVGFKVTMVPWELLPIVIVFVGAENMFSLVDAVVNTSVTLSVKQRIAEGLSRAGTSNTLKVVSYNIILGIIAVFAVGVIRQFCVFAIVVLVAHWFLAHTFFLAVLSIDIQRLELDELLRQNASLAPVIPNAPREAPSTQSRSKWGKIAILSRDLLQGRATKNMSLVLLLAITATLYYTTHPGSTRGKEDIMVSPSFSALSQSDFNATSAEDQTPAWRIWKMLNPGEDRFVHLRMEMPTVVTFRPEHHYTEPKIHRIRFSTRLRATFRFLKIFVLPIAATTLSLYGILLYLLKDAELLEAQRNKAEPERPDVQEEISLEGQVTFTALPRRFSTDTELIAASKDGKVVAAIGLENELVIWRSGNQTCICVDTTDILLRAASTSNAASNLTAITLDPAGKFCAVGTGAGVIAIWSIDINSIEALPHLSSENSSSGIVDLRFIPSRQEPLSRSSQVGVLVSVHDNGTAKKWTLGALASDAFILPSYSASPVIKCIPLPVDADECVTIAFTFSDGIAEIMEVSESIITLRCTIQAGNPTDIISKIHACHADLGGERRLIVGAATGAGIISLWDGETGECIYILDDIYGEIKDLRVSPVRSERCSFCGELPQENFSISFSIGHVVLFYKAYITSQIRQCACSHNQLRKSSSWELVPVRRSRSNSLASSVGSATSSSARRPSATFNNNSAADSPAFPVSGHGIHSRRASEKESMRRSQDNLSVVFPTDEREADYPVGPPDSISTSVTGLWKDVVASRVADATYERGSWDVSGTRIVGMRRKPRLGKPSNLSNNLPRINGLTTAALDRWEVWVFDPSTSRLQASPLIVLADHIDSSQRSKSPSCWQDRSPRLPFTRVCPFLGGDCVALAGMGNTIGVFTFIPPS